MSTTSKRNLNILFTCIGRRVALLERFRDAAKRLGITTRFVGADATSLSSALHRCDAKYVVPRVTDREYIPELARIVKKEGIGLIIPTVDLDLLCLSENRPLFQQHACRVLVSEPEVIAICQDKRETFRHMIKLGIPVPETLSVSTALARKNLRYPVFIKPWDGHAGRGLAMANNRRELLFHGSQIPNAIVQEYIRGVEYTCDAYVDADMNVRTVVPRRRIEVRSGEVSKAQVCKLPGLMEQVAELVKALAAGPGVITVQLIHQSNGEIRFIEVNPRFGGGAPLAIHAGADFPRWILQELFGMRTSITFDGFQDGVVMLRYDAEVWLDNAQIGDANAL